VTESHDIENAVWNWLPWVAVVCHTMLVVTIAAINYQTPGEASLLWNLFMIIDFPLSWVLSPVFGLIESWSRNSFGINATYSYTYAVVFAMVGGLQYFLVFKLLGRWVRRPR
jgi:hypothetical protein